MRGAWIEISFCLFTTSLALPSLPVRGAWIEIMSQPRVIATSGSLPVRGAWIEIAPSSSCRASARRRSPCGERGLKLFRCSSWRLAARSLPVRGAWIEMLRRSCNSAHARWSLPVRGAWIEIKPGSKCRRTRFGRSPCGERGLKYIKGHAHHSPPFRRSPCGERGLKYQALTPVLPLNRRSPCGERGLKFLPSGFILVLNWSLPVRGAWIEMPNRVYRAHRALVAPRAGSVD